MLRILAVVTAIAVGATAVYAQNADAIKQRREVMRTIVKSGSGDVFKMTKGEMPFDLAKVQAVVKAVEDQCAEVQGLFADDSKTGTTDAQPKIWTARAEFNAVIDKWAADAKAAGAAIKDEATFKAEYGKVGGACGGCHKASDGFAHSPE